VLVQLTFTVFHHDIRPISVSHLRLVTISHSLYSVEVNVKMVVFWSVASCSPVQPDDGGGKRLRNVGQICQVTEHPRRQKSAYSFAQKAEI
jgi:hypothetical protein